MESFLENVAVDSLGDDLLGRAKGELGEDFSGKVEMVGRPKGTC